MDKRRCGRKCVLTHCGKSLRNTTGIRIFEFPPKDSILGNIWRQVCGLPMDKIKICICETHFSKDFIGLKRLKKEAIPSLSLTPNSDDNHNSQTQEIQKLSSSSVVVKLESPYECGILNSAQRVVESSYCADCKQNLNNTHFYMGKCSLLLKENATLKARIRSYYKFKKRAQMKIFKLRNQIYYKAGDKSLRSRRDSNIEINTLNSKVTKQKQGEKPVELIQKQNDMEWKFLTEMTEDGSNKIDKSNGRISVSREERFECQVQPTGKQYHNELLSIHAPAKLEARQVKRNEIINRYGLIRRHFAISNKNKHKKMNDKAKERRLRLLNHNISTSNKQQHSQMHNIYNCQKTEDKTKIPSQSRLEFETNYSAGYLKTNNQDEFNIPVLIDEIKIEIEDLQETKNNAALPDKQNANSFFNTQQNDLRELSGSSKDTSMTLTPTGGTIKSPRYFRTFKESSAIERLSNIQSHPTSIYRRNIEEPLNNMRLLIKQSGKCDRFTIFGKHIAEKVSRSKKSVGEIKIAKALIDSVLQNLAIGVYSFAELKL